MRKVYIRLEGEKEEEVFTYDEAGGFPCFIQGMKDVIEYWDKYIRLRLSEPIDILPDPSDDDKAHLN